MTSDAKIGLLLGLVFIFIIAFIVNGLPSLRNETNSNNLTTNMVNSQNRSLGLATRERQAINQEIRYVTPLPRNPVVIEPPQQAGEVRPSGPSRPSRVVKKQNILKVRSAGPVLAKFYAVLDGDSLATIAKKFYGPEEGNKRKNIQRIFKANAKSMKSPDEIYLGQKLIIPPLSAPGRGQAKIYSVFSPKKFEKVESVGARRDLPAGGKTKQNTRHVVHEGDSLWRIADQRLGDGNRYSEIAKLNADILDDQDSIYVGMSLKLPVR